jgi:hypothetical protein
VIERDQQASFVQKHLDDPLVTALVWMNELESDPLLEATPESRSGEVDLAHTTLAELVESMVASD